LFFLLRRPCFLVLLIDENAFHGAFAEPVQADPGRHSSSGGVVNNAFTAEAGWRYEIMGEQMTKRFINIP
jgi:hypothetical protein